MGNCGGTKKEPKPPEVETAAPSEIEVTKREEMARVLASDKATRKEGDAWFVVEAAWVQEWLAYIQGGDSARRPGPINNRSLLLYSREDKRWKPKPLLRGARKEHMGHYRRVNPGVWELWCSAYEGSGPPIWVSEQPFEDTSNWQLDPNFDHSEGGGMSKANAGSHGVAQGPGGVPGTGGTGGENPSRLWPSASQTLAIGDMEDDRVGDETKAQAAEFFDYHPVPGRAKASFTEEESGQNGGGAPHPGPGSVTAPPSAAGGEPVAAGTQPIRRILGWGTGGGGSTE